MAESSKQRTIDVTDQSDLQRWCQFWQVSETELQAAIGKVGPEVRAVAFALGKEAYSAISNDK